MLKFGTTEIPTNGAVKYGTTDITKVIFSNGSASTVVWEKITSLYLMKNSAFMSGYSMSHHDRGYTYGWHGEISDNHIKCRGDEDDDDTTNECGYIWYINTQYNNMTQYTKLNFNYEVYVADAAYSGVDETVMGVAAMSKSSIDNHGDNWGDWWSPRTWVTQNPTRGINIINQNNTQGFVSGVYKEFTSTINISSSWADNWCPCVVVGCGARGWCEVSIKNIWLST